MASRKKSRNLIRKMSALKAVATPAVETISEIWYTNRQVWKILGISPSTAKRWRADGSLISSKKHGKVYFNHTHVQNLLKSGLKSIVTFTTLLLQFTDGWDMLVAC